MTVYQLYAGITYTLEGHLDTQDYNALARLGCDTVAIKRDIAGALNSHGDVSWIADPTVTMGTFTTDTLNYRVEWTPSQSVSSDTAGLWIQYGANYSLQASPTPVPVSTILGTRWYGEYPSGLTGWNAQGGYTFNWRPIVETVSQGSFRQAPRSGGSIPARVAAQLQTTVSSDPARDGNLGIQNTVRDSVPFGLGSFAPSEWPWWAWVLVVGAGGYLVITGGSWVVRKSAEIRRDWSSAWRAK